MTGCPSHELLAEFLSGQNTPSRGKWIEQHLLQCDQCCRMADRMTGDDELSGIFRSYRRTSDDSKVPEPSEALREELYALAGSLEKRRTRDNSVATRRAANSPSFHGQEQAAADLSGRVLDGQLLGGRYRLRERLGCGGFGVV